MLECAKEWDPPFFLPLSGAPWLFPLFLFPQPKTNPNPRNVCIRNFYHPLHIFNMWLAWCSAQYVNSALPNFREESEINISAAYTEGLRKRVEKAMGHTVFVCFQFFSTFELILFKTTRTVVETRVS